MKKHTAPVVAFTLLGLATVAPAMAFADSYGFTSYGYGGTNRGYTGPYGNIDAPHHNTWQVRYNRWATQQREAENARWYGWGAPCGTYLRQPRYCYGYTVRYDPALDTLR